MEKDNETRSFTIAFNPKIRNQFVKEPYEFVEGVWVCNHCGNQVDEHYGWHCPHCGLPIRKL